MLSLEECRKYLPEDEVGISDERLIELRDHLYGMAELALDDYIDNKTTTST
jgi:hypothetical protein